MSEVKLYGDIIKVCTAYGCYVYRASVGNRGRYKFGKKGQCDITGILPDGRRLEIEVKNKEGKLSQDQEIYIKNMIQRNAYVIITTSIEDVIKKLIAYNQYMQKLSKAI